MKIAIISTVKVTRKIPGIKITTYDWAKKDTGTANLRDFDGVIVDIDSFEKTEHANMDAAEIENKVFSAKILSEVLSEKNSFFIMLGKPSADLWRDTFAGNVGIGLNEVSGSGDSITLTSKGKESRYLQYLNKIKKYDYSYEDTPTLSDYYKSQFTNAQNPYITAAITPLLVTRAKHYVAFSLNPVIFRKDSMGRGVYPSDVFASPVLFLPLLPGGSETSVNAILETLKSEEVNDAPDWVEEMVVAGQSEIDDEIASTKEEILNQQQKLYDAEKRRDEIRKPLEVLYLSDKPLEKALMNAFGSAAFTVIEPSNGNNVEFYLTHQLVEFVTEVKSTDKATFSKEGMRQVNEWRENELLDTGKEYKPLLILSNEYTKAPDERNLNFIDENLIRFAKSRKIAVISVVVLYKAFQMIEEGVMTADELARVLYDSDGIITLDMLSKL